MAQLIWCLFFLQETSSIFLFQPLWMREQPANFFPDGFINEISAELFV